MGAPKCACRRPSGPVTGDPRGRADESAFSGRRAYAAGMTAGQQRRDALAALQQTEALAARMRTEAVAARLRAEKLRADAEKRKLSAATHRHATDLRLRRGTDRADVTTHAG